MPGTGDESKRLSPLLDAPQQVFVVDGPVPASGYDWYQIQPIDGGFVLGGPFGWVAAAGHDGEPWLSSDPFACPDLPRTFQRFQATPGVVWLACHGGSEISFPALAMRPEATCGADVGWTVDPEWLYSTCRHPEFLLLRPGATTGDDAYEVVLEPGVDGRHADPGVTPEDGVEVVITGHHDHADARRCRVRVYETWAKPEFTPEQAVLACRAQFVITAIEVIRS
jgi:hypothetical protein